MSKTEQKLLNLLSSVALSAAFDGLDESLQDEIFRALGWPVDRDSLDKDKI